MPNKNAFALHVRTPANEALKFTGKLKDKVLTVDRETGQVTVPVAAKFPLEEVAAAYDRFAEGGKLGKVLLELA